MDGQVAEQEKTRRSNELLELDKQKRNKFERIFEGQDVEVLFEESICVNGVQFQVGHTKEYVKVARKTDENLQNQLAKIRIGLDGQIMH